ncbi:hypothetical protein A9Q84_15150 [Halobacteriovorax marinus]|uniref:Uncharacterized protein n=1 Tax=Halobacteriovorax marinus TaxID=97084 RepID=A0A1Y5F983_9BACT|nr:hypothetical protein A9Q84_15150 [Halobacteriovorax marinus]
MKRYLTSLFSILLISSSLAESNLDLATKAICNQGSSKDTFLACDYGKKKASGDVSSLASDGLRVVASITSSESVNNLQGNNLANACKSAEINENSNIALISVGAIVPTACLCKPKQKKFLRSFCNPNRDLLVKFTTQFPAYLQLQTLITDAARKHAQFGKGEFCGDIKDQLKLDPLLNSQIEELNTASKKLDMSYFTDSEKGKFKDLFKFDVKKSAFENMLSKSGVDFKKHTSRPLKKSELFFNHLYKSKFKIDPDPNLRDKYLQPKNRHTKEYEKMFGTEVSTKNSLKEYLKEIKNIGSVEKYVKSILPESQKSDDSILNSLCSFPIKIEAMGEKYTSFITSLFMNKTLSNEMCGDQSSDKNKRNKSKQLISLINKIAKGEASKDALEEKYKKENPCRSIAKLLKSYKKMMAKPVAGLSKLVFPSLKVNNYLNESIKIQAGKHSVSIGKRAKSFPKTLACFDESESPSPWAKMTEEGFRFEESTLPEYPSSMRSSEVPLINAKDAAIAEVGIVRDSLKENEDKFADDKNLSPAMKEVKKSFERIANDTFKSDDFKFGSSNVANYANARTAQIYKKFDADSVKYAEKLAKEKSDIIHALKNKKLTKSQRNTLTSKIDVINKKFKKLAINGVDVQEIEKRIVRTYTPKERLFFPKIDRVAGVTTTTYGRNIKADSVPNVPVAVYQPVAAPDAGSVSAAQSAGDAASSTSSGGSGSSSVGKSRSIASIATDHHVVRADDSSDFEFKRKEFENDKSMGNVLLIYNVENEVFEKRLRKGNSTKSVWKMARVDFLKGKEEISADVLTLEEISSLKSLLNDREADVNASGERYKVEEFKGVLKKPLNI